MTELVVAIDFFRLGGDPHPVLDGWSAPEEGHRWTMGRESRLTLAAAGLGPDCVLAITATPCLHPPHLMGQTVMIALDERLLGTVTLTGLQVLTFRLPPRRERTGELVLSFTHLSYGLPRAPEQVRHGQPLGLMMHSVRIFRLDSPDTSPVTLDGLRGAVSDGLLQDEVVRRSGLSLTLLAAKFESIGQGCQFGLIQRQCGIEPLGLLRFVDTVTSKLVDALIAGFAQIDDPGRLHLHLTEDADPRLRWQQLDYKLFYDTRLAAAGADWDQVRADQARRLAFLRRKFLEDLAAGEKICVLTRGDCLTETEALAVYCALRLRGPNVLLWTVFGDPACAGQVKRIRPGFLRGQLGEVDRHGYGSFEAWMSVMSNALALA